MGPLLRTRRGRRVVLGMNMAHPERVTHAEALDIVRAYATAPGYPATNLAMRAHVVPGPEGIDVPVTLAWGEHDRLVRPPPVPPPGWRTVLLPDCGHLPMWDDPELVVRVIRATASADVIATPASAIAPPTAVSGDGHLAQRDPPDERGDRRHRVERAGRGGDVDARHRVGPGQEAQRRGPEREEADGQQRGGGRRGHVGRRGPGASGSAIAAPRPIAHAVTARLP